MNRIIMVLCLCVLTIPFFTSEAMGASQGELKCIITDSGMYTNAPGKKVSAPGTPTGVTEILPDKVDFTMQSHKIPAKLGINFGFRFTMTGLPPMTNVSFRKVVTYPAMHLPDGTISKNYETIITFTTSAEGTVTNKVAGYGFDHPFELVTGKWRFELWYGDHKLTEQVFDVVMP
jgi:hypothetical protein